MILKTKFDIGQEVVAIRAAWAERTVACVTCESKGKVSLGGEEFTCPKCKGTSKHPQSVGSKWVVDFVGHVGKVEASWILPGYDRNNMTRATGASDEAEATTRYMIDVTGIGSGQIWEEDRLFATREEAEAVCIERNRKAGIPSDAEIRRG